MIPAAIYVRVSTQDQADKYSLDAQVRALRELARVKGYSVGEIYNEGGISGESLASRPEILRLLQDAENKAFRSVLVVALDRLSRNLSDNLFIRDKLKAAGVRIVTPSQEYDPEKIEHDLTQNIFGSIADYERKRILERCQAGRVEKRAVGGWLGGHAPTGYRLDKETGNLVVDPRGVERVRRVYDLALTHSAAQIARRLSDLELSARQVRRLLERNKVLFYSGRVETYEGDIIPAQWPAIIPVDLADRVLQAKRGRSTRSHSTAPAHLLTGLGVFHCAKCGSSVKSFYGKPIKSRGGRRHTYYACSSAQKGVQCPIRKYIRSPILDRVVSKAVLRSIRRKGIPSRSSKKADRILSRIASLSEKIDMVLGMMIDGTLSETEGRGRIVELKRRRGDLERDLGNIPEEIPRETIDRILSLNLDFERSEHMRPIIEMVVDEIKLHKASLEITLRPPFDRVLRVPFSTDLSGKKTKVSIK